MKIRIEIECSPEEARSFFGLPDLRPLQEPLIEHLVERTRKGLGSLETDALLGLWMPSGLDGFRRMFRQGAGSGEEGKP